MAQEIIEMEIKPDRIRWFYRDETTKKWLAFNGYDSLRIETKYLELKLTGASSIDSIDTVANSNYRNNLYDSHAEMVLVRGGLFEVDVRAKLCFPIYWDDCYVEDENGNLTSAESIHNLAEAQQQQQQKTKRRKAPTAPCDQSTSVLRGSWFRDVGSSSQLEPLEDEAMAEEIEQTHVAYFTEDVDRLVTAISSSCQTIGPYDAPIECNNNLTTETGTSMNKLSGGRVAIHQKNFQDYEVEWISKDEIYLYAKSTATSIRRRLGIPNAGYSLVRGYNEEARIDDKPPDITHLCFVVHGIGQKIATGAIIKSCSDMRNLCNRVRQRYFPDLDAVNKRVEFLPVEWRSSLQLDGGLVDTITPVHMNNFRNLLNISAMDIMYYNSPLYHPEITQGLRSELNRLYSMFCSRHPYFEPNGGQVSIIAHSLGSVLIHDILSGWSDIIDGPINNNPPATENILSEATMIRCNSSSPSLSHSTGSPNPDQTQVLNLKAKIANLKSLAACLESQLASMNEGQQLDSFHCPHPGSTSVDLLPQQVNSLRESNSKWGGSSTSLASLNSFNPVDQPVKFARKANFPINFKQGMLWKEIPKIANFFCLGSPLSVFLAMRGTTPTLSGTQESILSSKICKRIFNIYHPADPIAYRLEPLVLKHYCAIQPLIIHRVDAQSKPPYESMPCVQLKGKQTIAKNFRIPDYDTILEDENNCALPASDDDQVGMDKTPRGSISDRMISLFVRRSSSQSQLAEALETDTNPGMAVSRTTSVRKSISSIFRRGSSLIQEEVQAVTIDGLEPNDQIKNEILASTMNDLMLYRGQEFDQQQNMKAFHSPSLYRRAKVNLQHRLDYQLTESRYETAYIALFTSHNSYWTNPDVALFIMTQIFSEHGPIGKPANSKL